MGGFGGSGSKPGSNSAYDKENPPMEGFNLAGSDSAAIVLADRVMKAMGGRKAWNSTHYIAWNFFGMRHLVWDKYKGDVRISYPQNDMEVIVNINTLEGRVMKDGEEVENADSLKKYLEMGQNIWINDAYWLVMPYKLKDSGVTLKYLGEQKTESGDSADVLELTFENVGETPQNKYHVFIDKDTHLVSQWAYYAEASQDTPNFVLPWKNYEKYGDILLSGDRGERQLTEIEVLDNVPDHTFKDFKPVSLNE